MAAAGRRAPAGGHPRKPLPPPPRPRMGAGAAAQAAAGGAAVGRAGTRRGAVARGAGRRPRLLAIRAMADAARRWRVGVVAGWGLGGAPARDEKALARVDQVGVADGRRVGPQEAPPAPAAAVVHARDAPERVAGSHHVPAGAPGRHARPTAGGRPAALPFLHPRSPFVDPGPRAGARGMISRAVARPLARRLGNVPPLVGGVLRRSLSGLLRETAWTGLRGSPAGLLRGPGAVGLLPVRRHRSPIRLRPRGGPGQGGRAPRQLAHHLLECIPGLPQPADGGPRPAPEVPARAGVAPVLAQRGGRGRRHGQGPEQRQGRGACRRAATARRRRKESPQHAHRILSYACLTRDAVNVVVIP
jgi:hypothetical protein